MRICILAGGPSAEHDVSLASAQMIFEYLDRTKYDPFVVVISRDSLWVFPDGKEYNETDGVARIRHEEDVVFALLALHGEFGEDGTVQALLDTAGIRYTGSGAKASMLGMDKIVSRDMFRAKGIAVPHAWFFVREEFVRNQGDIIGSIQNKFTFPLVIKPADRGSSVGISIVSDATKLVEAIREALEYSEQILVEEFIAGMELTAGVIEKDGEVIALPLVEITPKKNTFFDYESKYAEGGAEEIVPARISDEMTKKVQSIAKDTHTILGCRGYSRTDFIVRKSDNQIFVLEINTLPGLTKTSLLPKAAESAGIDFVKLLDMIIESAK